jgi:hypothetical protein
MKKQLETKRPMRRVARLGAGPDREAVAFRPATDFHHRVLGLARGESDPVRIITAAHIRLRRWRRLMDRVSHPRVIDGTVGRVRRIIRARDALLQQTYDLLKPGAQSPHN